MPDEPVEAAFPSQPLQAMSSIYTNTEAHVNVQ